MATALATISNSGSKALFIRVAAATRTLLPSESGAIVGLFPTAAQAAITVTLPAPAPGLSYTCIQCDAKANFLVQVDAGAGLLYGAAATAGAAGACVVTAAAANQYCQWFTNVSLLGDSATFWSDGTSWFVRGASGVANGMRFA